MYTISLHRCVHFNLVLCMGESRSGFYLSVFGQLCLILYFPDSPILLQMLQFHFSLKVSQITFYMHTILSLSIHLSSN